MKTSGAQVRRQTHVKVNPKTVLAERILKDAHMPIMMELQQNFLPIKT